MDFYAEKRKVYRLYHYTSVDSAINIINQKSITGAYGRNSTIRAWDHEQHPHFYLDFQKNPRDDLACKVPEIVLIFETQMEIKSAPDQNENNPYSQNIVYKFKDVNGDLWQAIVTAGSASIQLVKFIMSRNTRISPDNLSALRTAVKGQVAIYPHFPPINQQVRR